MDEITAHLDRGWDLAQKGDARGAEACAKKALEIAAESPEAYNLLGFATALGGEPEDAIEHYRQALALDETYFEAMLSAAEILIHPLGRYQEAIDLIDDAIDVADSTDENVDCLLLKADALRGMGNEVEAKKTLRRVSTEELDNANQLFMIARAYFDLGDGEKAKPLLEKALAKEPDFPDAHFYMGLLQEEAGDFRSATESMLRTRALDGLRPPPSWSPTAEMFGGTLRTVMADFEERLSKLAKEAEVYVVDLPGPEIIVEGVDPRSVIVIDRVPLREHMHEGEKKILRELPDPADATQHRLRIFVYQRNVELASGSLDAIDELLKEAFEREVAFVEKMPEMDGNAPPPPRPRTLH